jgi:hypothetical protein
VVEDCVDEDGKMMIASVLTEVTVTVAPLEEVEPATDDESDAWEEHRTDRERRTSKEANAIIQTSVKSRLENNSMRSGGESQCRAAAGMKRGNTIDLRVLPPRNG